MSRHFGQAAYFKILNVDQDKVVSVEMQEKATHDHGSPAPDGVHPGAAMVDAIKDCNVLISGGMGSPVYKRATDAGLQVILTRQQDIDLAVRDFLAGTLQNDPELVHVH